VRTRSRAGMGALDGACDQGRVLSSLNGLVRRPKMTATASRAAFNQMGPSRPALPGREPAPNDDRHRPIVLAHDVAQFCDPAGTAAASELHAPGTAAPCDPFAMTLLACASASDVGLLVGVGRRTVEA